jgi:hypothetical protein
MDQEHEGCGRGAALNHWGAPAKFALKGKAMNQKPETVPQSNIAEQRAGIELIRFERAAALTA